MVNNVEIINFTFAQQIIEILSCCKSATASIMVNLGSMWYVANVANVPDRA